MLKTPSSFTTDEGVSFKSYFFNQLIVLLVSLAKSRKL